MFENMITEVMTGIILTVILGIGFFLRNSLNILHNRVDKVNGNVTKMDEKLDSLDVLKERVETIDKRGTTFHQNRLMNGKKE